MIVNRVLEVRDRSAVKTLQAFLADWWDQYHLDALYAPVESGDRRGVTMQLIEDPVDLKGVNPFAPVMLGNSATTADRLIQEHQYEHLAVMLRPCELRAFVELQKRAKPARGQTPAVVIGVDCLGTFSRDDFSSHVQAHGMDALIGDVLRNATDGGLRQQGFRTACQICDWPAPRGADIAIGTIGVPTGQILLLLSRDEATDKALGLDLLVRGAASEYEVSHRETIIGAIADTRAGMRRTMVEEMQGTCRFDDLGCILAWIASCSQCGECLEACPLHDGEVAELISQRGAATVEHTALGNLVSLSRWLASCSGCGMCEEQCVMDVPLFLLISALSHSIRDKMHYHSGDPAQPLPWRSV